MTDVPGTIYLIHFETPLHHARHYLGWTDRLEARIAEHAAGRGSRLMAAVKEAGIDWRLARTWEGKTRRDERRMKRLKKIGRSHCPACRAERSKGRSL